MRFFLLCVATYAAQQVAGHSWLTGAGGGEIRQGLALNDDAHNQRYYCPTANLDDCQPDKNQGVVLTSADQRPCLAGRSTSMGSGVAGEPLLVKWASNGHAKAESDGTCVTIRLAKYKADPDDTDFTTLASCLPYYHGDAVTDAEVALPADLDGGDYTVQWYWNFASFVYSSCIDITVQGDSGKKAVSTKVDAQAGQPAATASRTDIEAEATVSTISDVAGGDEASPDVSKDDLAEYLEHGCAGLDEPKQFCKGLIKGKSYCKDFHPDDCGRARCLGDDTPFAACNSKVLLL